MVVPEKTIFEYQFPGTHLVSNDVLKKKKGCTNYPNFLQPAKNKK